MVSAVFQAAGLFFLVAAVSLNGWLASYIFLGQRGWTGVSGWRIKMMSVFELNLREKCYSAWK